MDSSSSDDTGSDEVLESLTEISSMRKSHRTGLSRGERSKRPLEDSDDSSDTGQKKELAPLSWHQSTSLGAVPSLGLTNDPGSSSRMSFEFDDDDSEMDDQDIEERNILDGPYGLGSPSFCWPPPGVENVITNEGDKKLQGDKKRKPGIIYLSSIPIGYNVSRTTGFFSQFGRVGRVFLQPGKYTFYFIYIYIYIYILFWLVIYDSNIRNRFIVHSLL